MEVGNLTQLLYFFLRDPAMAGRNQAMSIFKNLARVRREPPGGVFQSWQTAGIAHGLTGVGGEAPAGMRQIKQVHGVELVDAVQAGPGDEVEGDGIFCQDAGLAVGGSL